MRAATRAAGMADTRPSAALPSRGAVAPRKVLVGSGQQNAAAGARPHDEQEKCRLRAATTPLLQRAASRLASCEFDTADDICTPSPNVTVRARRKRRRRKALGSAEKASDANPASPPTSPSAATVPPASPRSLPSTPVVKSPPTHAPLSEPPLRRRASRRSLDALADGAERASRALPLRERVTFMRQTSRDAGVIHPNSGPRRLWDFCAALVAVAMVLNPNVNVMGSAFFVADAALNLHTGYVDRGGRCGSRTGKRRVDGVVGRPKLDFHAGGGTLILRRSRIMRHYATGWLLPDVLGALGPSALAAVPAPRRCAVGSYDTWWAQCKPPPPGPLQIARRILKAFDLKKRLRAAAPRIGGVVDAYLASWLPDLPTLIARILRLIRLLVALRCVRWLRLAQCGFRAVQVVRSRMRRASARRAASRVVSVEHDSIAHVFRKARRRFSVV